METFRFEILNDHPIIHVGDKKCFWDTGCPYSYADEPFKLLNQTVSNDNNFARGHLQSFNSHLGITCNAIIGSDVFRNSTIRVRTDDGAFDVGDDVPDGDIVNQFLPPRQGAPCFPLVIKGEVRKVCFDSGAFISYINPEIVSGMEPIGEKADSCPSVGLGTAKIYCLATALDGNNNETINKEYGVMDDKWLSFGLFKFFESIDVSAVVGMELLKYYDCTISWSRETISWTRRT